MKVPIYVYYGQGIQSRIHKDYIFQTALINFCIECYTQIIFLCIFSYAKIKQFHWSFTLKKSQPHD